MGAQPSFTGNVEEFMRRRSNLLAAWLCLLLCSSVALGQSDTTGSYDANALRVESHWGDLRIVRGVDGPVVGKIGAFSSVDLAKLVAPSENAVKEAREFNRNHGPGALASAVGAIMIGVSIAFADNNDPSWGLISTEVVGAGLVIYGGIRLNRAFNALSKSLWWYNRDLKR
jgi:hypothetical protein